MTAASDASRCSPREPLANATKDATLDAIVAFACQALHSHLAGVMLVHENGDVESAAVSDLLVRRRDELHLILRDGPCLDAMVESHVNLIASTREDTRWPRWGPAADSIDIRSVLSIRLTRGDDGSIRSLNVYSDQTHAYDATDVEIGRAIGRQASHALEISSQIQALERALETRTSIGQAEGILMLRYGIHADQAFNVLRRYSQAHNQPLRDIAAQVVRDRDLPAPDGAN